MVGRWNGYDGNKMMGLIVVLLALDVDFMRYVVSYRVWSM